MYCPSCGHDNSDNALFCSSCGKPLHASLAAVHSQPEQKPGADELELAGGGWKHKPAVLSQPSGSSGDLPGFAQASTRITGIVNAYQQQGEGPSVGAGGIGLVIQVRRFRVDSYDSAGNLVQSVPVEMYGYMFEGNVRDGDEVEVAGVWSSGQTLNATRVLDKTTGEIVRATRSVEMPQKYLVAAGIPASTADITQLMPHLDRQERAYIEGLIKQMNDNQLRQFTLDYSEQRREPQIILLTTLLGFVLVAGIQRFLLRQTTMGILYVFTGGFCLIGTIMDLMNYKRLAFEYNQKVARNVAQSVLRRPQEPGGVPMASSGTLAKKV